MLTSYQCFCANGDYHTMPTINIELPKSEATFNMAASQYMF